MNMAHFCHKSGKDCVLSKSCLKTQQGRETTGKRAALLACEMQQSGGGLIMFRSLRPVLKRTVRTVGAQTLLRDRNTLPVNKWIWTFADFVCRPIKCNPTFNWESSATTK